MQFFVPYAEDAEQTGRVEVAVRKFISANVGAISERRIFKLAYRDRGNKVTAEVGKPANINGETVILILHNEAQDFYCICTNTRGAAGGMPILVGGHAAVSVEDFE